MATALFTNETILKANFIDDEWSDPTPGQGQKLLVHSSAQPNTSGKTSIQVVVSYEDMKYEGAQGGPPAGGNLGFDVFAVIEDEAASGLWVPVACQLRSTNRPIVGDQPTKHIITLSPVVSNPGEETQQQAGAETVSYSPTQATALPDDYRLCLVMRLTDDTRDQLSEITFSAWWSYHD